MKSIVLLFLMLVFSADVLAQQPVTFSSDKLQEISRVYAGNSLNWPVVISLAEHDIAKNKFTLSAASLLRLRNLSNISYEFQDQQKRVNRLISEGAAVFAAPGLKDANQLFSSYLSEIRNGNLEQALEIGSRLKPTVDALENTLNRNRLVSVQAQLTAKDGSVDKRLGLLSGWEEAYIGDLFEESHGVKTKEESYATLTFTDGSNIVVNPSTTAIIRKSRIDKLDKSADAEITLVEGGLLSKLSAAGKERSKYILNAGTSTTELNTVNFYAENSGDNNVKLANYDGNAQVSANNVVVTIRKDEGTIIKGNAAPLPPVKLLDAPAFYTSKADTILYQEDFLLRFKKVDKAIKYRIEYSSSYDFDENVTAREITETSLRLSNLELGTTYLKIQSIDELGLKGPFSESFRIIRNQDTKAPPIFGEQFERPIFFTRTNSVIISGVTEPNALVTIDGKEVTVSNSGSFTSTIILNSNDQIVRVTSTDGSQNTTRKEVRVAQLSEEFLFKIKVNGVELENEISILNPEKTITGRAYPEMEIELKNGESIQTVKTDSQGRWGVTMNVQQGKLSVTFKAIQKSMEMLTKSFSIK